MPQVDVKALVRAQERFKLAARAYSDAEAKASKSKSDLVKAAAAEEFERFQNEAIDYVRILVTGSDGKGTFDRSWLELVRSNPEAFGAVFNAVRKKPYAVVFDNAERNAAVKPARKSRAR